MSTDSKRPAVPPPVTPTSNVALYVAVQCRGMELLGFTFGGSVAVCVHQLAVELWKRYDTPRVSVQKKIEELKIKLTHCTKEQIRVLRKASIIENFRATYVSLHDAEILCDALELSRKKRGLRKHALKSTGADRSLRREELRAKKMALRRAMTAEFCPSKLDNENEIVYAECALNRDTIDSAAERGSPPCTSEDLLQNNQQEKQASTAAENYSCSAIGTFLLAEDSYTLPGYKDCEVETELVRNDYLVNPPDSTEPSVPRRMDESSCSDLYTTDSMLQSVDVVQQYWYIKQPAQCLQNSSDRLRHADSSKCPPTTLTLRRSVSRIRSPSFCSSADLEEQSPRHVSSRSHSSATSPTKSSPERFLLLDSGDSDFEAATVAVNSNQNNCSSGPPHYCHHYRGIPHKGKQLREMGGSLSSSGDLDEQRVCSSGNCSSVDEGGTPTTGLKQHRMVKATKLRHYAKTTSPSSINITPHLHKSRPTSLLVSISLSSLSANTNDIATSSTTTMKPRKPTALSNFVTKKRALSNSPTGNHDLLDSPDENEIKKSKKVGASTRGGKVGRPPGRPRGRPRLSTIAQRKNQSSDTLTPTSPAESNSPELRSSNREPSLLVQRLEVIPDVVEDDQMSVASSTTSSANSIVVGNKKTRAHYRRGGGGRRQKQSRGAQNGLRIESNFSLESVFSYYPPTLTVKDGELVPERSLSIKNLDRFSLPSSHPIDRWSLGQPVRGRWTGAGPKVKRPRKNNTKV